MRSFMCFFVCSFYFCSFQPLAHEQLTIFTEQFPPYNFIENNEITGLNIDIVKLACLQAKIDCNFEIYPWKRAFLKTQNTLNAGLVSTSRTPARENKFQWVGPLISSATCFYKLTSRSDINVNQRSDLLNYTIGLAWSDVYEELLKKWGFVEGENYISFAEKYAYYRAFKSEKLDLFIASSNTLKEHLKKLNLSIEDVQPIYLISDPLLGGNYLALNKATEPKIVTALQAQITELMSSSTRLSLQEKYISQLDTLSKNPSAINRQCST